MNNNKCVKFGIAGSGWRSECFIRTAALIGESCRVEGIVSRNPDTRAELTRKWNIPAYASAEELIAKSAVDFLLVSVPGNVSREVIRALFPLKTPILSETPPAGTLEELNQLYLEAKEAKAKVQVAEQYWLSPMQQARLNIIASGKLGKIGYAHISVNHGYHNVSLVRKFLGINYENAEIKAGAFSLPVVCGPGRSGPPAEEKSYSPRHILAGLDFGGKRGLFDFESDQHRSWIRSSRVLVRGERGEISDNNIKYLKDYLSPVYFDLKRIQTGGDGNFEDFYLKGILAGEEWAYKNKFAPARLSDEEIAQASCLFGMKESLQTGKDFYSLAQAAQDHYLAMLIYESAKTGKTLNSESQSWAKDK